MKKLVWILLAMLLLAGCAQQHPVPDKTVGDGSVVDESVDDETAGEESVYMNISAQEAKKLMDTQEGYVILDTREQEEYDQGHIPGAILLPHGSVMDQAEEILPDKDQLILVYCRSGRRSKIAAEALVELGYTNVREFGGIIDWPYEVE